MAHRTGRCLETKEAFKAVKAGSEMALLFLIPLYFLNPEPLNPIVGIFDPHFIPPNTPLDILIYS
jgi:hypothetical protein